jgi:sugar/nucleoside kinase (ribokinase family)
MKRILIAGDVTFNGMIYLERFPSPRPQTVFSQGFHETVGGTAAGKALNLHRLGFDVTLHGLIGDDPPGQMIRAYFAREKLRFIYDVDPKGTQRHVNLMEDGGGRISIYVAYATFDPAVDLDRLAALIPESDYVAINLSNYCRRIIPLARQWGKPIWCDIHDYDGLSEYHRDFIQGADYLTMSSDALPDFKPFMEKLIVAGKKLVVCTHGRGGSTALTPEREWIETPSLSGYPQVDTNGAGDSFFAGLLYGHSQGYDTARCLRLGTLAAGLCITSRELAYPDLSADLLEAEYRQQYGA